MSREKAVTLSKQLPHHIDHLLNMDTEAKKNGVHELRLIQAGSEKESQTNYLGQIPWGKARDAG